MDVDTQEAGSPAAPSYPDGSRVLGMDGLPIGEVVASYREHLIVERGYFFPTNYYIPFSAVADSGGGDVVLNVSRIEALTHGWDRPPADPIAPAASTLPAPPPDPIFAGTPGPETTRRPFGPPVAPPAVVPAPQMEGSALVAGPAPQVADTELSVSPDAIDDSEPKSDSLDHSNQPMNVSGPKAPDVPLSTAVDAGEAVTVVETTATGSDVPVGTGETAAPLPQSPPPSGPSVDVPHDDVAETAAESGTSDTPETATGYPAPMVGIPGRRLSDAELWSLLEPKEESANGENAEPELDEDEKGATPRTATSGAPDPAP